MRAEQSSFYEWQNKFSTQDQCLVHLAQIRWTNGYQCPHCGHDHGYLTQKHYRYECASCHRQTSVTAGTLFHNTKLPLVKWFWAIYWMGTDKGGISALRLSKLIGVTWTTAYRMLQKLRISMGNRDSLYRLSGVIELDDAFVGGKKSGKRGRGAEGKASVVVAIENKEGKAGFIAMEVVDGVNKDNIGSFTKRRILKKQTVRTDAYPANNGVSSHARHVPKVTPSAKVDEWLPIVHLAIANLKRFLLGTFHGTSTHKLQNYLNEFCYRFNRRFWESEIPNRLLRLCIDHRPISDCGTVS